LSDENNEKEKIKNDCCGCFCTKKKVEPKREKKIPKIEVVKDIKVKTKEELIEEKQLAKWLFAEIEKLWYLDQLV
jgi:hypothetical protein